MYVSYLSTQWKLEQRPGFNLDATEIVQSQDYALVSCNLKIA